MFYDSNSNFDWNIKCTHTVRNSLFIDIKNDTELILAYETKNTGLDYSEENPAYEITYTVMR